MKNSVDMVNYIDEKDKLFGSWKTIEFKNSEWLCECTRCKFTVSITGTNLRRNKLPWCKNCCRTCGKTRDETAFRSELSKVCSNCKKNRIKIWRDNTGFCGKLKEWRKKHPESHKTYGKSRVIKIQSSPYLYLTEMLRQRIQQYKTMFSSNDYRAERKSNNPTKRFVTINDKVLHKLWDNNNGKCAISGMSMTHKFNDLRTVSIDRIDSNKGYDEDNIQLVCQWVNLAKGKYSNDYIIEILKEYRQLHIIDPGLGGLA